MKKVKNILNQENIQKTLQQEEKTPRGPQKLSSSKKEFITSIDNLFLKLELAYHYQFYKVFGTDERLNEGKKLWAVSLKSFSLETIAQAIENVIGSQSYLPTLTDIVKACSEINSYDGFPSVEEAYIEARKSFPPRQQYSWSHPIVYFAGKKIGWNLLDERDSKELFHSFKKVFNTLKENAVNGAEFKIEPIKEIPLSEPFNKKLFESLRKKHKV
ncbi:replication protein P [Gammaproteobacteria bacterium]|nr:replication protein P [Gammaproteobacteria bacterium]